MTLISTPCLSPQKEDQKWGRVLKRKKRGEDIVHQLQSLALSFAIPWCDMDRIKKRDCPENVFRHVVGLKIFVIKMIDLSWWYIKFENANIPKKIRIQWNKLRFDFQTWTFTKKIYEVAFLRQCQQEQCIAKRRTEWEVETATMITYRRTSQNLFMGCTWWIFLILQQFESFPWNDTNLTSSFFIRVNFGLFHIQTCMPFHLVSWERERIFPQTYFQVVDKGKADAWKCMIQLDYKFRT